MLPEAARRSLLRCGKRPTKAICLYVSIFHDVYRLFLCYVQNTIGKIPVTCTGHRIGVRPSLRLILSGSGNTAWEQVSDQGCHNRVYNMCILFFCPACGLSFMREPVRNRCGQRLCRGAACLAGQAFATLRLKAGKDRPHPAYR